METSPPRTPPPHSSSLPTSLPNCIPSTPPRQSTSLVLTSPSRAPATPRHRKFQQSLQGTKPFNKQFQPAVLAKTLKGKLKLPFEPDAWQLELLSRLLCGFDSILCAGTGYGKSLIFEGLAVLGGKKKAVVVICPLKALEHDQMAQANAKGIVAIAVNEDNSHEARVWEKVRTHARIIYLSPEMSQSDGFAKLWRDSSFRKRLVALVVDEAHCIEEWGTDDFRPLYQSLSYLRHYTGQDVPFFSCTATCQTVTFEKLWTSLAYGFRPFWGLDVGTDRPNLFFDVVAIENTKNPILDLLNLLPRTMTQSTLPDAIPKTIIYMDSEDACRQATETFRKCLPAHLRSCVHAFSSILSTEAKTDAWVRFSSGECRILCATDAAGMGCNVPDIRYIVIIGSPRSFSVVAQRWGRAGRDRRTLAVCILLVPRWAFCPTTPDTPAPSQALRQLKGKKKVQLEPKRHTEQRAKLPTTLEEFINLKWIASHSDRPGCLHRYLRETFRPHTRLTTYTDLSNAQRQETGTGSSNSSFALIWTALNLQREPEPTRCCWVCNPAHPDRLELSRRGDARLSTYAHEFIVPLVSQLDDSPSRPPTALSTLSVSSSSTTAAFEPLVGSHSVSKEESNRLRSLLTTWREKHVVPGRDYTYIDPAVDFPDSLVKKLVDHASSFLSKATVAVRDVRRIIHWDSATEEELEAVAKILADWRIAAAVTATPKSQRRSRKKAWEDVHSSPASSPTATISAAPLFGRRPETTPGRRTTLGTEEMFPMIYPISDEHNVTPRAPLNQAWNATPSTPTRRADTRSPNVFRQATLTASPPMPPCYSGEAYSTQGRASYHGSPAHQQSSYMSASPGQSAFPTTPHHQPSYMPSLQGQKWYAAGTLQMQLSYYAASSQGQPSSYQQPVYVSPPNPQSSNMVSQQPYPSFSSSTQPSSMYVAVPPNQLAHGTSSLGAQSTYGVSPAHAQSSYIPAMQYRSPYTHPIPDGRSYGPISHARAPAGAREYVAPVTQAYQSASAPSPPARPPLYSHLSYTHPSHVLLSPPPGYYPPSHSQSLQSLPVSPPMQPLQAPTPSSSHQGRPAPSTYYAQYHTPPATQFQQ